MMLLYSVEFREQKFPEACNVNGAGNSEKGYSRQLGFRCMGFSETVLPALSIPGN